MSAEHRSAGVAQKAAEPEDVEAQPDVEVAQNYVATDTDDIHTQRESESEESTSGSESSSGESESESEEEDFLLYTGRVVALILCCSEGPRVPLAFAATPVSASPSGEPLLWAYGSTPTTAQNIGSLCITSCSPGALWVIRRQGRLLMAMDAARR